MPYLTKGKPKPPQLDQARLRSIARTYADHSPVRQHDFEAAVLHLFFVDMNLENPYFPTTRRDRLEQFLALLDELERDWF